MVRRLPPRWRPRWLLGRVTTGGARGGPAARRHHAIGPSLSSVAITFASSHCPPPSVPSAFGQRGTRNIANNGTAATWGITCEIVPHTRQLRAMSSHRHSSMIDMAGFGSLGELISAAHANLDALSDRDISAFWTEVHQLLRRRSGSLEEGNPNAAVQLEMTLCHTLQAMQSKIDSFSPRDLAQTAIALAKIMKRIEDQVEGQRGPSPKNSPYQLLHGIFIGKESQNKQFIMKELAVTAMPMREEFPPRELSNVIYAFGLTKYVLEFDDGSTTFDALAKEALSSLENFNGQDFANMLWAYANVEVSNPALFKASADVVAARDSLESFDPQALSNTVWAYATLDESHPKLFEKVADHIVSLDSLGSFLPQHLSNMLWAFATAKESHPKLFQKVADHIVTLDLTPFNPQELANIVWAYATANETQPMLLKKVADHIVAINLRPFKPQALSNTVWAYATAKESHPKMFNRVADHIVSLDSLEPFNAQNLSNTVWAYATAGESHPKLFKRVSDAAIQRQSELIAQDVANLLWAFATNGELDRHLFDSFAPTATNLLDECNVQNLSNIAWAYAVANVDAPALFNGAFINSCIKRESEFILETLRQLHQWNLWQEELKSNVRLPPTLEAKCRDAFVSAATTPSALQDDVISELTSVDLQPQEEYLTARGYRLDALVEVNGSKAGVEVDGPSHFLVRQPTGSTLLKHRLVATLDGIPVVSVPYWEWNKLGKPGKNSDKKQQYLRSLLGLI